MVQQVVIAILPWSKYYQGIKTLIYGELCDQDNQRDKNIYQSFWLSFQEIKIFLATIKGSIYIDYKFWSMS